MDYSANGNGVAARLRDLSPEPRHLGCWSWVGGCLGKQKRAKRVVPASRSQDGSGVPTRTWGANGTVASATSDHFPGLSPSLLAPPSSPASIANSGNPSSVQSPAGFTVSLSVASGNACSPVGLHLDRTATMFTIGPYAHETALVTPPVFSAFTTPPSTAPFTPPPELAHLTTPSSPDVPFAQLLASSLNAKGGMDQGAAQHPASLFTSSDDVTATEFNQLYPESPITQLVSPNSGASESEPSSPLPGAISPNQGNNTQIVFDSKQETSFLILKPLDASPLNLAFSANKLFSQTLRHNAGKNGSIQSLGAKYCSDLYFHQRESDSVRSKSERRAEFVRDKQDHCKDMGINLCHAGTFVNSNLEYIEDNASKDTHLQRDVKDQEWCQKPQKKFSGDLFTSYNIDGNVQKGHSVITSCYVQNLVHPAAESHEYSDGILQQTKGRRIGVSCGNAETDADCNLKPSGTCDGSGIFELGSKDLKHTLSNRSISFLPSTEETYPRHFDAAVELVSGLLEASTSDSCLEIPRISFSTAEFLLPTRTENLDTISDGVVDSNSYGDVVESSKSEGLSPSCNVFAVALEKTKEVSL
ncbi:hypothetical protein O6H91_14G004600 [Diphasiastrum complanatum]|uniref:Uncharacterized protein n=1 Tax=Diphasiastrum complanatum TaxID=34168 RepID=A0ACC2BL29_DIPCM|nr:hypothetical protein O6H91_Y568200 [Diphasiastrum complanatum]KAJ7530470.1 hypothetical protein O6H91_14G004600 [Diphasiastrum complanatum]